VREASAGQRHLRFWLLGLAAFLIALYFLGGILLPFVAGMAIAYFLDPVCDRLETLGCSRSWAVSIVGIGFVLIVAAVLLLVLPMLQHQVVDLANRLPGYATKLSQHVLPQLQALAGRFGIANLSDLGSNAAGQAGSLVGWLGSALLRIFSSGVALANLLSLLFITPVVAFYLLRDWDRLLAHVDGLLPRAHASVIRTQLGEIDRSLAGFARGQATVCLLLALYYAVGLSLVGLDFGLAVGLGIGLFSFVPYVGSIAGFITAFGIALAQFDSWLSIGLVVAVFAVGQFLEGNVLAPRLVGNRVGLHPVWVIFALLAGGALFGFVGLLLAMPAAAVAGVLIRFAVARYRESPYYRGEPPWPSSPST
jgi:predicted PurR-regulated permease PerM